jgi:methylmalonyl-CoA mutase
MTIHAVTSRWNKAMYDPYVNMLRTTTEAMSAIIAGIDSLSVGPFNEVYEKPDDFSERIARNQQLLLKEESYLDRVADPSAGSYYIESLTDSIAAEAWKLFLEVDAEGGFVEAVTRGSIQNRIAATAKKRNEDIASRRETILGVNQYPNFTENKAVEMHGNASKTKEPISGSPIVPVLKPDRAARPVEALRYKTDRYAADHKRPAAFMLTYGNLSMRIARSQFSRNFFACAGFEVIDNLGFKTAEEGVNAFLASQAEILVICSADEEYPTLAPAVKELVGEKGILVVAGYPKDIVDELKAKGIEHFIHVRSNLLEELSKYQELLGL